MKLTDNGILRILEPEEGYRLYSPSSNSYYDKVYLGKNDSPDNYLEIDIRDTNEYLELKERVKLMEAEQEEAQMVNDEQDSCIIELVVEVALINLMM